MTLTLDLPPDLEQILCQTAQQQGITAEALALQFLAKAIGDRSIESFIDSEEEDDDDLENDPTLMAEIEAARADYVAGDYVTFEDYLAQRRASAV